MRFKRFPKFGNELERGFPVHENCYDCVEFYNGCDAWPENRAFQCGDYYPLPSVMPGTLGQVFPPSRMQGRKEPRIRKVVAEQDRSQPRRAVSEKRRKYMTNYMRHRRAARPQSKQVSDVPSALQTRPSIGPQIENVNTLPPAGRVPRL